MAEFFSFGNPISSMENAYVLVQFGIEEIGKIIFLQEAVTNYAGDSILVDKAVFTKHNVKAEKA
jgi:AbiV family abortive infection protein